MKNATDDQHEQLLVECMKRDLPLAWNYMHRLAHRVQNNPEGEIVWSEDPNSPLGKQLIRIHTDALRPLLITHGMHGVTTNFVNCCGGVAQDPKKGGKITTQRLNALQIQMQNGDLASPDC